MTMLGQALKTVIDAAAHEVISKAAPRTHILLACMPKSGSTFLSNAIGRLPSFRKTSLVTHYGRTEQDLDSSLACRKSRYNYVCQHHVRYNEKTRDIVDRFSIAPVVLVRDLHDCVVSLRDHLRRESVDNTMAFVTGDHIKLSDEDLETFIVQMAIPWYINFYVSWQDCPSALWVNYRELATDGNGVVEKILAHCGRLDIDEEAIKIALGNGMPATDRLNVGQQGRGRALSEENKALIRLYCSYYPSVDFSPVGVN